MKSPLNVEKLILASVKCGLSKDEFEFVDSQSAEIEVGIIYYLSRVGSNVWFDVFS